jgi:hypothetical protein
MGGQGYLRWTAICSSSWAAKKRALVVSCAEICSTILIFSERGTRDRGPPKSCVWLKGSAVNHKMLRRCQNWAGRTLAWYGRWVEDPYQKVLEETLPQSTGSRGPKQCGPPFESKQKVLSIILFKSTYPCFYTYIFNKSLARPKIQICTYRTGIREYESAINRKKIVNTSNPVNFFP